MFVGRINKANPDVSRFSVDLSEWLDDGEVVTSILTHMITLGTTGWSNTPFPVPGAPPPYDPTPLLFSEVKLMDSGTMIEVYVLLGTPGNVYTCQFEVAGSSLREVTFEVGVQITGPAPAATPVVPAPVPSGGLSIYGGQMLGPLYLYHDPGYPSEASTKQYVDYVVSLLQVDGKVNRSGDNMAGFLTLYQDPVQPLQAATKNYVDVQTGSSLHDAPNDTFYYGRHALSWSKVTEEAPTNIYGYVRSNGAWIRGVPAVGPTIVDVRVTDGNAANTPALTGMFTPFSAATDLFTLAARRASTGAVGDGGAVQLFGPTYAGGPNAVNICAGPRATARIWGFFQDGSLNAPGAVNVAGTVTSTTGRVVSKTNEASIPSVVAWDLSHNVASGFWLGPTGTIRLGQSDGNGAPVTTWTSVSSSGVDITGTLSTSANILAGTSLKVTTSLAVGTDITAQTLTLTGTLTGVDVSTTGTLSASVVNGNSMTCSGPFQATGATGTITGQSLSVRTTVSATTGITAGNDVSAGGSLFASGQQMAFGNGGSGRIMQFQARWYWDWHIDTGRLDWVKDFGGTPTPFWVMDQANSNFCYNNIGFVGGHGAYANLDCSVRLKTDITDATQGLAQVLKLMPKTFRRLSDINRMDLGFIIEEVREVIPEAVLDMSLDGPGSSTLAITDTPILAAAINAIKELHLRLQALEAR